jgi:hypothetical protein
MRHAQRVGPGPSQRSKASAWLGALFGTHAWGRADGTSPRYTSRHAHGTLRLLPVSTRAHPLLQEPIATETRAARSGQANMLAIDFAA